jgi:ABC-type branched-subunit amino acid transport system substrate-binding protein
MYQVILEARLMHSISLMFAGLAACLCTAQQPLSKGDGPIVLGMSTALTGPAAGLGLAMKAGIDAAISEINGAGGIDGRPLELRALDDGYEPARAGPNMKQLVADPNLVAIVGNVGTPTAVVSLPIAREARIAFYGAYTGAGLLRSTPPDRYVINFRASYAQETAAMVDALIKEGKLQPREIGFFTQRDAYGDAGFSGGLAALKANGLSDETAIAHGRYERNTLEIDNALADLLSAPTPVKAVIMVGTYAPSAAFIKAARDAGFAPLFLNVSFVGTAPLIEALGSLADGVIITQVVPSPQSQVPLARDFAAAVKQQPASMSSSFGAFEGYASMKLLERALRDAERPLTREGIVTALEKLGTIELGLGQPLSLSATDHQASDHVWPTIVREGKVVSFDWATLNASSQALVPAGEPLP